MTEMVFFVETGKQSVLVNKILKAADLVDGAVISDGSGYEVYIKWKDDEVIDASRIARTKQNLRNTFENLGICVLSISQN